MPLDQIEVFPDCGVVGEGMASPLRSDRPLSLSTSFQNIDLAHQQSTAATFPVVCLSPSIPFRISISIHTRTTYSIF
jgi:hypothetical protein